MGNRIMDMIQYIPLLLKGALITCIAWLSAGIVSLLVGTILGIISCQFLTSRAVRQLIGIYTFIAKGVPAYVQILIAYFVIPAFFGINIPGFLAAVIALIFCSSGYVTEIVRAAINSIDKGQWDACYALGYPLKATLLRIILPQTFVRAQPALLGEFEQLLKSTSLLATIGVAELTRTGMNIISRELNPIQIYLIIALIYLMFSALLQLFSWYIEKKTHAGR